MIHLHQIPHALLLVALGGALYARPPEVSGPAVQLTDFLPADAQNLIKGTDVRVSAGITLVPSLAEPVEFISGITINGRSRRRDGRFDTVLLPPTPGGSETVNQTLTWFVKVKGPKRMTVRLRISGIGRSSQKVFTFADVTNVYAVHCNDKAFVLFRWFDRLLGFCS